MTYKYECKKEDCKERTGILYWIPELKKWICGECWKKMQ